MMKLTAQADRVAFILAIIDTMKCAQDTGPALKVIDVESVLAQEVQKRPRLKPCVAEHRVFPSTISAAHYLAHHRPDLWVNSAAARRQDAHAVMENLRNRVKNWCNGDTTPGYYWI